MVFTHKASGQEIVFVAEAGKDKTYKFDVDLGKSAKEFDHLSGDYEMRLVGSFSSPLQLPPRQLSRSHQSNDHISGLNWSCSRQYSQHNCLMVQSRQLLAALDSASVV